MLADEIKVLRVPILIMAY